MFPESTVVNDQQDNNVIGEPVDNTATVGNVNEPVSSETVQQTTATDFDPNAWQLNYRGQKITPQDRDQLVNYAQMGLSYSQSMQALKEEKLRLSEQYAPLQQYAALDQKFREDPNFQDHLVRSIQEYHSRQNLGSQEPVPEYVQQLLQRVEGVESYKQQLEQQNADTQLASELNAIKASNPNANWEVNDGTGTLEQKLLKHAYENNIPSLKTAYRDLMFDQVALNAKAEALKEAEAKKVAANKAGKVGGVGGKVAPDQSTVTYTRGDNYQDALNKAMQLFGNR